MKKLTNKIPFYWAIQLLSVIGVYSLVHTALCQAEVKEKHNLSLEITSDIAAPPNKTIWATIANTSATVVNPAQYKLVVTEERVYKNGKKRISRVTQREIPLENLLDSVALQMSEIGKIINFAPQAHKSIDSSLGPLDYYLKCHIEDSQSQRVSNEIEKASLSDKTIVQERVDCFLNLLIDFLAHYVVVGHFKYIYQKAKELFDINTHDLIRDIAVCYEILGLKPPSNKVGLPTPESDIDEIQRAYRRRVREYHPDKNKDQSYANKKTQEINNAYDFLTKEAPNHIKNPQTYNQPSWLKDLQNLRRGGGDARPHTRPQRSPHAAVPLLLAQGD